MTQHLPDRRTLHLLLDYDQNTGVLTWKPRDRGMFKTDLSFKQWNAKHAGKPAFTSISSGYRQGLIFKKKYLAHRVIWKWMTGEEVTEIDHRNGNRSDNRWGNLRSVDRMTNCRNQREKARNTSGYTGVFWEKGVAKWRAQIRVEGRNIHLGVFNNIEDAARARKKAEQFYGFSEHHGSLQLNGGLS